MNQANNYEIAKKIADSIDNDIINVLKSKRNFLVEAGAGSGKTHSLLNVISWLEDNADFSDRSVACITYTNVAVDEIKERISNSSTIIPSTIHTFAWESIKRFQKDLINSIFSLEQLRSFSEQEIESINKVNYTLGVRFIEDSVLYLHHDDVIEMFSLFLNKIKFRKLLSKEYSLILIDEYQDSPKLIMEKFLEFFINQNKGPQFGLFGDYWQTIYSLDKVCGQIKSENIVQIKKKSNFRSQETIVEVLNNIRPELPQLSAINEDHGEVVVILTNNYLGPRISKGYYKDELPDLILHDYILNASSELKKRGWSAEEETTKIFMLTHKMLSKQQEYSNLLEVLNNGLKNQTDPHVVFFNNYVEPIYNSLSENDAFLLFEILGTNRQPLETRERKHKWKKFYKRLDDSRNKRIYDVLKCAYESKLVPISDAVLSNFFSYERGEANPQINKLYQVEYGEVINALSFFNENSIYATNHGVKGAEFDNVFMVMGKGWNNYRFENILYRKENELTGKELESYIRNRNLFYVGCSRAKKRLAIMITIPVENDFIEYLQGIFGKENIIEYADLVKS